jgi:sugar transferase (PEP-CTERM system associated)
MLKIGGQKIGNQTMLLVGVDALLIAAGLLLATSLRLLYWHTILAYLQQPGSVYRFTLPLIACQLALHYHDLYTPETIRRFPELLIRLLQALGTAFMVLAIVYFIDPDHSLGRGIAVLTAPIVFSLLLSWRVLLRHKGLQFQEPERILVLGTGAAGIALVREIISRPELKLKVVGFLDETGENIGKSLVNPGIIGAVASVEQIAAREGASRVILSLAERRGNTPVKQLLDLKFAGIRVEDAHTVWEQICGRIHLQHLSPSWLILSDGFRKSKLLTAAKRTVDFLAALVGLVVTMPVLVVSALAIWFETGSPILFKQERTGMWSRSFQILKFRSMRHDAERNGPSWAKEGDDRITRVGRVIRKLRLDELPQFVNVLRGEMSLVGPRPERPVFCKMLQEEIPMYAQRHSVRPGITGWAQVKYQYGASVEESKTKLEYDLFYIKHMSLVLDVAIIFETVKVLLTGRGAK